jgi:hypothetical protein
MAKLVEAGMEVLKSLIKAAQHKEKHLGSWYALNDPDYDASGKFDAFKSQKIADDIALERALDEFKRSLSDKSRRLRRKWKKMADSPEMFDEPDILEAKEKYDNSLTDEQREAEAKILGMLDNRKTNKLAKLIFTGMENAGSTEKILNTIHSAVTTTIDDAHKDAGLVSAIEAVIRRTTDILEGQYPGNSTPISMIMTDGDEKKWQMFPSGTGSEKGFELSKLLDIMNVTVASELADPAPWQRVNAKIRGISKPAFCIEGKQFDYTNMHACIAAGLRKLPGMANKIVPIYKIDGVTVNESMYRAEVKRRQDDVGWPPLDADYTGLTTGTMFIGPEAEAVIKEYFGTDLHRIKAPERRAR